MQSTAMRDGDVAHGSTMKTIPPRYNGDEQQILLP